MFRAVEFPGYKQLDQMDCGPTCLKMISEFFGKEYHMDYLRQISFVQKGGATLAGLASALEEIGLDSIGMQAQLHELINEVPLPAIAHWNSNHFVVVYKTSRKYIYVSDPAIGKIKYTHKEFKENWTGSSSSGILLIVEPTDHFGEKESIEVTKKSNLRFLIDYLMPYRKYLNQVLVGLLLATLIQLILPFLTQSLVDYGINFQNIGFVYLIVIAQLFLFLSRSATEVIRDWLLLYVSNRVNIEMISSFLDKLLKLPVSYFESKTTGDFMQRINDHHRIDEFLSGRALTLPFDVLYIICFAAVLFYFDPTITFIFLLGTSIFLAWSFLFLKNKEVLDHQLFEFNRKDQSLFLQILLAITEIKLNNSESRRKQEWKKNQYSLFNLQSRILKVDQAQIKGGRFISELTNIIIVFWSAKAVIAGEITLGTMLAIQFIIGSIAIPISNTIDFLVEYQRAMLSLQRLSEVHNQIPESITYGKSGVVRPGEIKFQKVSFRYGEPTTPWILKELEIVIPHGKTTAIVGASGSGKTTLLKLLSMVYDPTEGQILVGDANLKEVNMNSWRNSCGVVLQDGVLFNDTIERNITESNSKYPTNISLLRMAVKVANLTELIEKCPMGYDTKIGEQGQLLSGGEKQRLLIARAIYKDPPYLFFDEATSSLDSENEKVITENLYSYYKNRTVVVVAHRLSTVRHADQILVMNGGEIVEKGNHEELINLKGFYHNLIKNQLAA